MQRQDGHRAPRAGEPIWQKREKPGDAAGEVSGTGTPRTLQTQLRSLRSLEVTKGLGQRAAPAGSCSCGDGHRGPGLRTPRGRHGGTDSGQHPSGGGPPPAPSFMKHTASQGRAVLDTRGTIMNVQSLDLEQLRPTKERDSAWAQRQKRTKSGSRGLPAGWRPCNSGRSCPRRCASLQRGASGSRPTAPRSRAGRLAGMGPHAPKASGLSVQGVSHIYCWAPALQAFQQAPSRNATWSGGRGDRRPRVLPGNGQTQSCHPQHGQTGQFAE